MKADVKSEKFHRIRYLMTRPVYVPLRFLFSCVCVIWAFRLKPYPSAFKEFGIRVVAPEDDGTWNNHIKVYAALELLNRYDKEKLELVKKHIRIIYLWPSESAKSGYYYMGTGVCFLNFKIFPAEMPSARRAINIIGWLVYVASKVKFAGKFGTYFRTGEEVEKLCKEEQQRTLQKFRE